jgi:hypothetical protein
MGKATPMTPRPASRRHQALAPYLAHHKVAALCRPLVGSQRWRYTWRAR